MTSSFTASPKKKLEYNFMPSTSFGFNNLFPLHTDNDMLLSIVHVHCAKDIKNIHGKTFYKLNNGIVKYFSFDNGITVGMRSGDILIFNPIIPHCVSSSMNECCNDNVFCVSHYFKSLIAGRNNNSIAFKY